MRLWTIILASWALAAIVAAPCIAATPAAEAESVAVVQVREDVAWLAGAPTRLVGSAGHDQILAELVRRVRAIPGVQVWTQSFRLCVPRVLQAELRLRGETHRVYPLWPASVRLNTTPAEGVQGRLLYIGEGRPGRPEPGRPADVLPARSLRGQIAVMEITGADRWKSAFDAGARAVILLGSDAEVAWQFHTHLLPIPVDVPRFYVPPGPLADRLRAEAGLEGTLLCRSEWVDATATNVYALVKPAASTKEKALAIGVAFDATGVVPELAPGADAAVDVAAALGMLRRFAAEPPARPVLFAFVDGYGVNQRGLREMLMTLATGAGDLARGSHVADDAEEAETVRRLGALAEEIAPDPAERLREDAYRRLRPLVENEAARRILEAEQEMLPRRVDYYRLLHKGDTDSAKRVQAEIDALRKQRSALDRARERLLFGPRGEADAGVADLAQEIAVEVCRRAARQSAQMDALLRTQRDREGIRGAVLSTLGFDAPGEVDGGPIGFLFGIDLSDSGLVVGPCLQGRYLRVNETLSARSFSRWLVEADRKRPAELWPGGSKRAVELGPFTRSDARDCYVVGDIEAFTSPTQSFALPAVTWATLDAPRERVDTPRDRADLLDWLRLAPQIDATFGLVRALATDRAFEPRFNAYPRWSRIEASIVDQAPGEPVPRLPVAGCLATLVAGSAGRGGGSPAYWPVTGMRWQEFQRTGADGKARFEGIPGVTSLSGVYVQAYEVGPDGRLVRAVDMLREGKGVRLNVNVTVPRPDPMRATVFRCAELTLAELFDPRFLMNLPTGSVADAESGSTPRRMNLARYGDVLCCQMEPGLRWLVALRAGITDNRMALVNLGKESGPDGRPTEMRGFAAGEALPNHPWLVAAQDFYRLDSSRLDDYARAGVESRAIRMLERRTKVLLDDAERATANDDGAALLDAAGGALANEIRAYQAVRDTGNDVVRGAIFLLLMLVPFSYALERLVLASAHIYRQIAGVIAIFAVMAFILWQYHPAFRISSQPLIIIMSFAILFMSMMVLSVVYSKFASGLEEIQSGRAETTGARTSRVGLVYTALRLGIANMRRRKFRTVLTGTTIVLITFAMLCFMSTSSYVGRREFGIGSRGAATGLLIRQPSSSAMPRAALLQLSEVLGRGNTVVPRYWWNSQSSSYWLVHVRNPANGKAVGLRAAVGLTPEESGVTKVAEACPDWSRFGDESAPLPGCYLGEDVSRTLEVKPGDRLVIAGRDITLLGFIDTAKMDKEVRGLDGEPILPIDYSQLGDEVRSRLTNTSIENLSLVMASGTTLEPDERLPRVPAASTVILPASMLAGIPGTTLRSVAVTTGSAAKAHDLAVSLADRFAFPVYYGSPDGVRVIASTPLLPRAPKSLIIPVIIAGLIIFNTMLSSIAERKREIYIYTSLGLAPLHVGFLFLAEAVTYGLMGSIFGYVVGQGMATVFTKMGWMGGLVLNYSGTQAVLTMVMVLGIVVVSSLVPAFMAGRLAVPSNEMRWRVPAPVEGVIRDKLPFTVTGKTANGVMTFLHEYLDAHREGSIGNFSTADLRMHREQADGSELMRLSCTVWLAPYDLGIRQEMRIEARAAGVEDVYTLHVELTRRSGQESSWWKLNRGLLADLRRQLLGWRKLKLERMLEYIAAAKERAARLPASS